MAVCDHSTCECSCPFAFTEASEIVQNYGCLPSPMEIAAMRVYGGRTWACHSDITKPCIGAITFLKEHNLPHQVLDTRLVHEQHKWDEHFSEDDVKNIIQTTQGFC